MKSYSTLEVLKRAQIEYICAAKKLIFKALKELEKRDSLLKLPNTSATGHGIYSPNCDMSMYIWLPVMYDNFVYWITFFGNYVDGETANFHTDFGRVCFVKPFEVSEDTPLNNAKLNKKLNINDNIELRFPKNNWHSPLEYPALKAYKPLNGKWLTVDDILSHGFDMEGFVSAFYEYVKK